MLIRLQRIYNLWSIHAILLSVLMITGFIIHFYITFGTNLLTGGPSHIAVLLPISVFRRKGISNGVQMEWNHWERDFWNKRDPEDFEWTSSNRRGGHEAGGAPTPLGAPSTLVGPSWLHRPTSSSYLYLKNTEEHNRSGVPPPQASVATKKPLGSLFWHPARRGNPSPVAIFIIPTLSMTRRE